MPTAWTERRFDDLEFHVRMRLGDKADAEYEVRSLRRVGSDLWFVRVSPQTKAEGVTQDFNLATRFASGTIVFHGSSHTEFGAGVSGGSRRDMTRLGPLFDRLYDLAIGLFRDADPNFDHRYLQG